MLNDLEKTFTEYYVKYYVMVHRSIYHILHNFDDATELTQELFAVLYEKMEKGLQLQNPPAWLRTVSVKMANNYKKQQIARSRHDGEIKRREEYRQQRNCQPDEMRIILAEIIQRCLTPQQRELLQRRIIEKAPLKDITGQTKKTVGSVRHNYNITLRIIRHELKKQGL